MPILTEEPNLYPTQLLDQEETPAVDSDRQWWAAYTKPRQEKAFARQLLNLEVPFYLPLVSKFNLIRGRRVESFIPLFGGYCFVCVDAAERVQSLSTNRVLRLLAVENQQQLLFDLRQVRQLIAAKMPLTVEGRLQAGDRVRVRRGPLEGVEGVVVARRAATRLIVNVSMLQQGVSVMIDDFVLEPL